MTDRLMLLLTVAVLSLLRKRTLACSGDGSPQLSSEGRQRSTVQTEPAC